MTYEIFEGNMERLQKKLATIQNKCKKYGCEFKFDIIGEAFHSVTDDETGEVSTMRFIQVDASGIAKVNNWEFVATIEHMSPINVVRSFRTEYEIPARYYTANPVCEHCNSKRNRKDTYLIRNTETGEFKQVGKSCLKDFTNGLSAEAVAQYISWFNEVIEGTSHYSSGSPRYYKVFEVIKFAVEAVNLYGYQKANNEISEQSTKEVVIETLLDLSEAKKHYNKGFNAEREGNKEKAQLIIDFVAALPDEFGYVSNLKALCSKEYCNIRDMGILVSSVACYNREMAYKEKKAKEQIEKAASSWVGNEGERITINDASVKLLTSWENMYGVTYMYEFTDNDGNIYIWKTGKHIGEDKISLKGTVKAHGEFNGVKQTELTRCKII